MQLKQNKQKSYKLLFLHQFLCNFCYKNFRLFFVRIWCLVCAETGRRSVDHRKQSLSLDQLNGLKVGGAVMKGDFKPYAPAAGIRRRVTCLICHVTTIAASR